MVLEYADGITLEQRIREGIVTRRSRREGFSAHLQQPSNTLIPKASFIVI